jgi:AcrR family transcriptional regulator
MTRRPAHRRPVGVDQSGRPVRPALTRDYIIRTALAIVDRDGITGLSMRKLAAEIGTNPMAFYHHLPNKAALFDGVVEAVFAEVDIDLDAMGQLGWRERVRAIAHALRETLRRHPHVLVIIATRPAYTGAVLDFGDRALAVVCESGFNDRDALIVLAAVREYTIGQLLAEVASPIGGPTLTANQAMDVLTAYPTLARATAGGYAPDDHYELVLESMLDGFGRRLRRARRHGASG